MYAHLDQVIRKIYVPFGVPADRIGADSTLSNAFSERVNDGVPSSERWETDRVNWRLLTLINRGRNKGGLPRLDH